MTSKVDRVAIVGTGLIGTSVAMAAVRVGCEVSGWDVDTGITRHAARIGSFLRAPDLRTAVEDADLIVVATPISSVAGLVVRIAELAPAAVITDAASVKRPVIEEVAELAPSGISGFVPGHPMGGSERSGPEHASASLVDSIVWAVTPLRSSSQAAVERLESWIVRIGGRPARMSPERHDRLVAFVSHLPQVASTALMDLAATEEAGEPEILLLAAGGFRDLTRLAASDPALWSDILVSNRAAIAEAIDLYAAGLQTLRAAIVERESAVVEDTFARAKNARLRLATKPRVRAGVAVLQVPVPDRPGSLAVLTAALGERGVNIEDLQIVHSPEGGRGTVHLTVVADAAAAATAVLAEHDFDPVRLA